MPGPPPRDAGTRLIVASSVSVALYLSLTAISILKPWGRTARGRTVLTRPALAPRINGLRADSYLQTVWF